MLIPFETLNLLVGFGAVVLELGALFLLVLLYFRSKNETASELSLLLKKYGLLLGFLLTLGAFVMSLYYSEVLLFEPCGLCWTMRVFMYSQLVIFGVALFKKDRNIADYIIALSIFGFLVGLYQHYLQLGGADFLPCPSAPTDADCSERIMFEFGHVTFPWVGSAMFLFLIALASHFRESKTK